MVVWIVTGTERVPGRPGGVERPASSALGDGRR